MSALVDLARLRSNGHGLFGSGDRLFSNAIFGRDSVTAGETLLHLRPDLARDIILTLARLQGTVDAPSVPTATKRNAAKSTTSTGHCTSTAAGSRRPPSGC